MRIAVAGATGSIGKPVAAALAARGHEVRALSRSAPDYPVDLTTGAGLDAALEGCDALVDASNAGPQAKAARAVLIDGGRRLLDAAGRAGVSHHVCLSIVGIEQAPMPYYEIKVEQEALVRASGVPATIVRATQFHTLIQMWLGMTARFHVLAGGSARFQPVAPAEVAEWVADVAEGEPRPETVTIGGPEETDLGSLARTYKEVKGLRAAVFPAPMPPKLGKAMKAGALTIAEPDHRGTITFAEWLRGRSESSS
jgi:uncharacterized protein YbjT (DUF2867 family)